MFLTGGYRKDIRTNNAPRTPPWVRVPGSWVDTFRIFCDNIDSAVVVGCGLWCTFKYCGVVCFPSLIEHITVLLHQSAQLNHYKIN